MGRGRFLKLDFLDFFLRGGTRFFSSKDSNFGHFLEKDGIDGAFTGN